MFMRPMGLLLISLVTLVLAELPGAAVGGRRADHVLVYANLPPGDSGEPIPDTSMELFTVRLDGTGFRRLTRTWWWEYGPAASPDGRSIAYSRGDPFCHANSCRWGPLSASLWVTTLEGRRRPLTDADAARENDWLEESPSWSPDAKKVAFVRTDSYSGRHPANGIYIIGADGRGLERLSLERATELEWSPRGSKIAYVDEFGDVVLLDVATRREQRLRTGGLGGIGSLDWSPRGNFLALSTGRALFIVSVSGGRTRKVAAWPGADGVAWSPDGCCLAFSGKRKGARYSELFVVSVRGGKPRRLTSSRGADVDPTWRR